MRYWKKSAGSIMRKKKNGSNKSLRTDSDPWHNKLISLPHKRLNSCEYWDMVLSARSTRASSGTFHRLNNSASTLLVLFVNHLFLPQQNYGRKSVPYKTENWAICLLELVDEENTRPPQIAPPTRGVITSVSGWTRGLWVYLTFYFFAELEICLETDVFFL